MDFNVDNIRERRTAEHSGDEDENDNHAEGHEDDHDDDDENHDDEEHDDHVDEAVVDTVFCDNITPSKRFATFKCDITDPQEISLKRIGIIHPGKIEIKFDLNIRADVDIDGRLD